MEKESPQFIEDALAELGPPTRASVRALLDKVIHSDVDLEAFCIDHFPEVFRDFTQGMQRKAKLNIVLGKIASADIVLALFSDAQFLAQAEEYSSILEFANSLQRDPPVEQPSPLPDNAGSRSTVDPSEAPDLDLVAAPNIAYDPFVRGPLMIFFHLLVALLAGNLVFGKSLPISPFDYFLYAMHGFSAGMFLVAIEGDPDQDENIYQSWGSWIVEQVIMWFVCLLPAGGIYYLLHKGLSSEYLGAISDISKHRIAIIVIDALELVFSLLGLTDIKRYFLRAARNHQY